MNVKFHRNFKKLYDKLPAKVQTQFKERLVLFLADPFDAILRNHSLTGEWAGRRSINITGNYRAIYKEVGDNIALFEAIGTHSKLYGREHEKEEDNSIDESSPSLVLLSTASSNARHRFLQWLEQDRKHHGHKQRHAGED